MVNPQNTLKRRVYAGSPNWLRRGRRRIRSPRVAQHPPVGSCRRVVTRSWRQSVGPNRGFTPLDIETRLISLRCRIVACLCIYISGAVLVTGWYLENLSYKEKGKKKSDTHQGDTERGDSFDYQLYLVFDLDAKAKNKTRHKHYTSPHHESRQGCVEASRAAKAGELVSAMPAELRSRHCVCMHVG